MVTEAGKEKPAASKGDTAVDNNKLTQEEQEIIELLRTPKLSIKHMDEPTRQRIRSVIQHMHHKRGISLGDIAKLIGNKTSGYTSWLARQLGIRPRSFHEAQRIGIHKLRKYERKPFDGTDEDKAYMLGLRHGDLSASVPFGDVTRVSTSTTHPALSELFEQLFCPYGHVYKYPRRQKDTNTYEWNLQTILDRSFGFLLESRDKCREWVMRKDGTMLAYLAGLIDAEGNIRIYPNPRTIGIIVSIWNTDIDLLEFAYRCLKRLGYRPLRPYLSQPPGGVSSGFHIARKKAEWRVMVARFDESQSLLGRLPLMHREKVEMKELALSVRKGQLYQDVRNQVSSRSKSFDQEAAQYTKQAEQQFLERHHEQEN